ncbi:hypothetical protein EJB05_39840, partial [Eragrostis curvula]
AYHPRPGQERKSYSKFPALLLLLINPNVSYVAVPADGAPPEPIKLNAMEAQWVALPLLQHLLCRPSTPFSTLATYRPLAIKLVHLTDTGDVAISCSACDAAVKFVVAESDADARRLAGDEEHDVHTLERLVPEVDMSVLPAPVPAVQATPHASMVAAVRLSGSRCTTASRVRGGVARGRPAAGAGV